MEESSFEVFMQFMIAWLFRGRQMEACIRTWQIDNMGKGFLTPYSIVWDPGDFMICERVLDIPYRYFSLNFQERRVQTHLEIQIVGFGVVQHRHHGLFLGLDWDHRIVVLDNTVANIEVRAIFCSHEVVFLVEQFPQGLIQLLPYKGVLLIGSIQEDPYVLQDYVPSIRYFTLLQVVWDIGIIFSSV